MLYLGENDILEAADFNEVMDAIENAYRIELSGDYNMPNRIHINNGENTLLYMPCFLSSCFGTKFLTLFPENIKRNRPVIEGVVLLNSAETGAPLAILDGAKLTAVRTGAVGGVAIRHIAKSNAKKIGLIGAGVQGLHQVLFACKARKIEQVYLFDLCAAKLSNIYEKLNRALPGIAVEKVATVNDLLEASDLVITATPSTKPVLPDDQNLLRGKSFIGIGSYKPEMREFPRALYNLVDKVLIDTEHGLEESGDLITPLKNNWITPKQIIKFGAYLAAKDKNDALDETMFFKSVGMALFDIVVSELVYRQALEKGIGTILS